MGDGEVLAGQAVEELAGDRLARGEGDAVDEDVEAVPVLAELLEAGGDLRIVGDVERQHDIAADSAAAFSTRDLQFVVLVGERQFRAFAVHGLGDAAGDGTLAGDAGDQCALALQESHVVSVR